MGVEENQVRGSQDIYKSVLFFTLRAGSSDLGENVRAEHADREHNQHERDHQVNERNHHLTELERDATDRDRVARNALARSRGRGEEGRQDVLRQRLEKLSNHASEIERRREDDNVPGIKHFY